MNTGPSQGDGAGPAAFRAALGRFASGVTVVSTVDPEDGVDHALTASAFTSVSLNPPLILVSINRGGRFHDPVLRSGRWAVSLLSREGKAAATWFATSGRPLAGQLERVPHRRGDRTGAALLSDALAWLECETWAVYDGADHSLLVGAVLHAEVDENVNDPLLYYRSHYASLVPSRTSEKAPAPVRPERDAG
jgi:flavin reductase (DIM6/NTAB) family NADH-FMN oxidoreductase RutF